MKRINHHQHDNTLEMDIFLLVKTKKKYLQGSNKKLAIGKFVTSKITKSLNILKYLRSIFYKNILFFG